MSMAMNDMGTQRSAQFCFTFLSGQSSAKSSNKCICILSNYMTQYDYGKEIDATKHVPLINADK